MKPPTTVDGVEDLKMKHGKLTKKAGQWLRRNPTLGGVALTLLQQPTPQELEGAYQLYKRDTYGLRSEMTQDQLNRYIQMYRSKMRGEY